MSNNSKTILALISGVFAGAILGIYFASGKEVNTKNKIHGMAEDTGTPNKDSKDAMADFKEKLHQKTTHHEHNGNGHIKKDTQSS